MTDRETMTMEKPKLVKLELLAPVKSPTGARWAAGERAGFTAEEADDLIKRGLARKAPAGPPKDKMLDGSRSTTK